MGLAYSIVIATRNRPEALALSVPRMLAQSVPPACVIIADSSDDPTQNRALAERLTRGTGLSVVHAAMPVGSALQRNLALEMVETPVVAMPDDDSLMRIDAMARIMAVYERDAGGLIGGVGGYELAHPDDDMLPASDRPVWQVSGKESLRKKSLGRVIRWESRVAPDPLKLQGQRRIAARDVPPWLVEVEAIPVEWITGFRMTFRTDVARRLRFTEALGRYALYEDIDMSLRVLQDTLVVACLGAGIYHHRWPSDRANGRAIGAMQMLNRAFVLVRTGDVTAGERRALWRWALARAAVESLRARTPFDRSRRDGFLAALKALPAMLRATPEDATEVYLRLRAAIFEAETA